MGEIWNYLKEFNFVSVVLTVRPRVKVDKSRVFSVISEMDGVISVEQLN